MRILVRAFVVCICIALSLSAAPNLINYQGRLSDPGGNPVADGNYNVTFRLYDSPVAGTLLGSFGPVVVTTSDGLFATTIGLGESDFIDDFRYLGIQVGADPEIAPRTLFTSVPYSFRVETVDGAIGGTVVGSLAMQNLSGNYAVANALSNSLSTFNSLGVEATRLWGPSWGQLFLFDNDGDQVVELSANSSGGASLSLEEEDGSQKIFLDAVDGNLGSTIKLRRPDNTLTAYLASGDESVAAKGGELELMNEFGLTVINLNASTTGNSSVNLPDDAIWSPEMFNEPGIANSYRSGGPLVNSSTDVSIDTVSITVPTAGYVVVTASGYFDIAHVTGTDTDARFWVSPTGATDFDKFSIHTIEASEPTETYYAHFSITFVDVVGTGSTQYVAAADQFSGAGSFTVDRLHLVAQFFPTAYGTTVEVTPPNGPITDPSATGTQGWQSQRRVLTLEDHRKMVDAEVAKLRAELDATSARLQKLEEQQQQQDENN